MKRLVRILPVIVLFNLFYPAFASCGQTGFTVFDGLNYRNKPDLGAYGLKPVHIAYTSEIFGGASSPQSEPNQKAIISMAQKIPPNVPLVLDLEAWNVQGNDTDVGDNINKLIQIVDWVHQANPMIKVGYFGLMPVSNPWIELNYVRVLNNPQAPSASSYKAAYLQLQRDNARIKTLASHVDFVCPVVYTFNNLNGAAYDKCWDLAAKNAISESRQYGKPVYVFVWPQFYDLKATNGDNAFVPDSFWQHELQLIQTDNASGLIIWGSTTFRKSGWNSNDPWWKVTMGFIPK